MAPTKGGPQADAANGVECEDKKLFTHDARPAGVAAEEKDAGFSSD
ncbi:MAG TPA: hypothetical protein VHU90_04570 [Galbitalea sp.]|jgi:hypothetical protein|nr:hypothetical protein [Galbitalea sp.]